MTHHNIPLLVIGGTLVWAGWYSFNGCSALAANVTAGLTLLNTHLSGSTGALCWVALTYRHDKCFHVTDIMNGAFAGLAGVTPCSGYAEPQGAVIIGLLTGVASWHTCKWLKSDWIYIDDVLDVFSLQAVPGMMGSILVGFFKADTPEMGYNQETDPDGSTLGLLYGGNGLLLGSQLIGTVVTALVSACMTYVIMFIIKQTVGIDITWEEEDAGLDISQIGEIGYDYISIADNPIMDDDDLAMELVEAAAFGNFSKCRKLLEAGARLTKGDYDKRTALHLAAAEGNLEICRWCVENGANVHAVDGFDRSPFEDAVLNNHQDVCDFLASVGGSMAEARVVAMLCEAAFDDDVEKCTQLLDRVKTAVTGADYDGRTALHIAVCENNLATVQLLMGKGADPAARDRWGKSPMDHALDLGLNAIMVKWLEGRTDTEGANSISNGIQGRLRALAAKRRKSTVDVLQQALLEKEKEIVVPYEELASINKEFMKLAASGDLRGIRILIEKGANPGESDYDKRTPLHLAAAHGHNDLIKFLLLHPRVSVNAADRFRTTALADALKGKHEESAEILKSNGGTMMNSGYGTTLCAAAARGDIYKLQTLLGTCFSNSNVFLFAN
jgi:ankyrin repeat protein